jgi:hypothetical protein
MPVITRLRLAALMGTTNSSANGLWIPTYNCVVVDTPGTLLGFYVHQDGCVSDPPPPPPAPMGCFTGAGS